MACCGSRAANVGTLIVGRRHARAEVWGAYRSLRLGQTDGPLSPGHSRHLRDVVAASLPTAMRFGLRRKGFDQPQQGFAYISPSSSRNRPEQTSSGFVRKGARPRVTQYVLSPSCQLRIDVAEVRPQPLGQLAQPRRLIAELDHVQDESIDPRGFVHGRTVNRRAQLRELTL